MEVETITLNIAITEAKFLQKFLYDLPFLNKPTSYCIVIVDIYIYIYIKRSYSVSKLLH